ncbi:hypothetical protein HY988_03220 [Candidatus Micrarchaeota archaeon]|nr:hypothetical protein [Candidatus Micrarchaeota archaeon]
MKTIVKGKPANLCGVNLLDRETPDARSLQRYFLDSPRQDMKEIIQRISAIAELFATFKHIQASKKNIDEHTRQHMKRFLSLADSLSPTGSARHFPYPLKEIDKMLEFIRQIRTGAMHVDIDFPLYRIGLLLRQGRIAETDYYVMSSLASEGDFFKPPHFRPAESNNPFTPLYSGIVIDANIYFYVLSNYLRFGKMGPDIAEKWGILTRQHSDFEEMVTASDDSFNPERFLARAGNLGSKKFDLLAYFRTENLAMKKLHGETDEQWILRKSQAFARGTALHEATHRMDKTLSVSRLEKGKPMPEITADLISILYSNKEALLLQWLLLLTVRLDESYSSKLRGKLGGFDKEKACEAVRKHIDTRHYIEANADKILEASCQAIDAVCQRMYGKRHDEAYDIAELKRIAATDFVLPGDLQLLKLVHRALEELL